MGKGESVLFLRARPGRCGKRRAVAIGVGAGPVEHVDCLQNVGRRKECAMVHVLGKKTAEEQGRPRGTVLLPHRNISR